MDEKRKECYSGIFNKIDYIEDKIIQIKEQLATLKEGFLNTDTDEACLDVIEAEKALLEIVNEGVIDALLQPKPKGDA